MKIVRPPLRAMVNEKRYTHGRTMANIIEEFGAEVLGVADLFNGSFMPAFRLMDAGMMGAVGSDISRQMADADDFRDEVIIVFLDTIKTNLRHYIQSNKDAANLIKVLVTPFGNIVKKEYDAETAAVINLLQELRSEKYKAAVETLGLTPVIDEIDKRNKAFDNLSKRRDAEKAARNDIVLKEIRIQLDSATKNIFEKIEALVMVFGKDKYEPFIRRINALNVRYGGKAIRSQGSIDYSDIEDNYDFDDNENENEEKYPNAKEYTSDYNPSDWKNGDIGWIIKDGVKVYYELIDERSIDIPPTHIEWEAAWKLAE